MTYRVYARWPEQRVSHKTVTESKQIAELAYDELLNTKWETPPKGIAFSDNGKTYKYFDFSKQQVVNTE
jgi:hypothetical protein